MNISSILNTATKLFADQEIDSARLDAELLLASAIGIERNYLIAHNDEPISAKLTDDFDSMVSRRLRREPIAYIIGNKEFYGRKFIVTPDVLIPRPETEQIIDFVKDNVSKPKSILDVGTGSGAIAITLGLEIESVKVTASDISGEALRIAENNAVALNSSINFVKSDLLTNVTEKFDMIVANLPYVDTEWDVSLETNYEPKVALFADDAGLALIKKLIVQSINNLNPKGSLVLEMDSRQIDSVIAFAKDYGFTPIEKQPFLLALQIQ